MSIFLSLLSFVSLGWLVYRIVRNFVYKKRVGGLLGIYEVGRTRMLSIRKDIIPIMVFYGSVSYNFPTYERFFAYLTITMLVSLILFERIMIFRRRYPIQTMWLSRFTLAAMFGLILLTASVLIEAI